LESIGTEEFSATFALARSSCSLSHSTLSLQYRKIDLKRNDEYKVIVKNFHTSTKVGLKIILG